MPTGTVTKSTTKHGGAFAAQLQTQSFLGQGQVPGEIILSTSLHGGSLARPASLQFYYQLSGSNVTLDSTGAFAQLIRRVNGSSVVVAEGEQYYPVPKPAHTLATIPLRYLSTLTPDSVVMAFASGTVRKPAAGTTLLVDNISFGGSTATATREAGAAPALSVAPNPSPNGRYRLSSPEPALLAAPLVVFDATSREVRREAALRPGAAATDRLFDLHDLPVGVYTVQVRAPDGVLTRQRIR